MFYILELQTAADGTGAHLMQTAQTQNEAMSKYHQILAYAATSDVYVHAAIVVNEEGKYLAREDFKHLPEPEPEDEGEPEEVI